MSFAASMNAISLRPSATVRAPTRSRPRFLQVHNVTNWIIEPKQNGKLKSVDLTDAVADKATATVKSGGGGDFQLTGLEDLGLELEFRSEGAGQSSDAPADLYIKDLGSKVPITLDGKSLEKNKEYKLSIGQEIKIGDDAIYQILRDSRAHA